MESLLHKRLVCLWRDILAEKSVVCMGETAVKPAWDVIRMKPVACAAVMKAEGIIEFVCSIQR
jgi:hypothetical protein